MGKKNNKRKNGNGQPVENPFGEKERRRKAYRDRRRGRRGRGLRYS